jgi:hypothetical protein
LESCKIEVGDIILFNIHPATHCELHMCVFLRTTMTTRAVASNTCARVGLGHKVTGGHAAALCEGNSRAALGFVRRRWR